MGIRQSAPSGSEDAPEDEGVEDESKDEFLSHEGVDVSAAEPPAAPEPPAAKAKVQMRARPWLGLLVMGTLVQAATVGLIAGLTYVIVQHHKEVVVVGGALTAQGDAAARPVATARVEREYAFMDALQLPLSVLRTLHTAVVPLDATRTAVYRIVGVEAFAADAGSGQPPGAHSRVELQLEYAQFFPQVDLEPTECHHEAGVARCVPVIGVNCRTCFGPDLGRPGCTSSPFGGFCETGTSPDPALSVPPAPAIAHVIHIHQGNFITMSHQTLGEDYLPLGEDYLPLGSSSGPRDLSYVYVGNATDDSRAKLVGSVDIETGVIASSDQVRAGAPPMRRRCAPSSRPLTRVPRSARVHDDTRSSRTLAPRPDDDGSATR